MALADALIRTREPQVWQTYRRKGQGEDFPASCANRSQRCRIHKRFDVIGIGGLKRARHDGGQQTRACRRLCRHVRICTPAYLRGGYDRRSHKTRGSSVPIQQNVFSRQSYPRRVEARGSQRGCGVTRDRSHSAAIDLMKFAVSSAVLTTVLRLS
jgi:hypothetical protein